MKAYSSLANTFANNAALISKHWYEMKASVTYAKN